MKDKIKVFFTLLPVILSFLLLSAHFSRADMTALTIISLLLPFSLFIKHPLLPRIMQILLILGSLEWIRTTYVLASARINAGQPWIRLVIILGVVSAFTLASAMVFSSKKIKTIYKGDIHEE